MAKRTKEQIQKEVEEASAKRREKYFGAKTAAQEATKEILPDLPQADIYKYDWAWRQDVGGPTGEYKLVKTPNGLYDPSTNEIVDPVTGKRTKVTMSLWSGPTTFRAGTQDTKDPITGLTPAQMDAAKALAAAKSDAEKLAAQLGAKIDPKTGKIDKNTIDPVKAAAWYKTQVNIDGDKIVDVKGNKTIINRVVNPNGTVTIFYSDGTSETVEADGVKTSVNTGASTDALLAFNKAQAEAAIKSVRESAFALLKLEFDKYGLGSLVDTVKKYIMEGSPVEEVTLKLRESPEYQKRFEGNQIRLKSGLNLYDEATYLQLENAYDQVFTSYGVTEAAGNTVEARRAKYAQFIGGTISPDEVKGRVQLAVAAANEDEVTKATLRELYPSITDKDIVSYFLNPKETLPKLETKVRASQIGAAAVRQGLVTNVATAEELAAMGITEQEAERAYSAYAGMKPTLDLLSGLEKDQELAVNQKTAEGALLKGLASEQRKIEALRQKELGRFSGSSGTARGVSLGSQTGGLV